MAKLKYPGSKGAFLLSIATIVLYAATAVAQSAADKCRPASVIPLASEPPTRILIDPPLSRPAELGRAGASQTHFLQKYKNRGHQERRVK